MLRLMKRVIGGVVCVVIGLLGIYCSLQAVRVYRELNGRPDIHDEARNWSTGAMACFVACGVAAVLTKGRKMPVADSADNADASGGRQPSPWWKTSVGITLLTVVLVAVVVVILFVLQPPPPAASPVAVPALPAPARAP